MWTALLAIVALAAIVIDHTLTERRHRSTLNMERARQDQLMNRLAARSLTEYNAVEAAVTATTAPAREVEQVSVRYLYDESGLIRIPAPADIEDPAYEAAGSM